MERIQVGAEGGYPSCDWERVQSVCERPLASLLFTCPVPCALCSVVQDARELGARGGGLPSLLFWSLFAGRPLIAPLVALQL